MVKKTQSKSRNRSTKVLVKEICYKCPYFREILVDNKTADKMREEVRGFHEKGYPTCPHCKINLQPLSFIEAAVDGDKVTPIVNVVVKHKPVRFTKENRRIR